MARKTAILKAYARTKTLFALTEVTDEMRAQYPHLKHCSAIFANSRIEAQCFPCETSIGGVMQCTMIRHGNIAPLSWEEIQKALHELFGPEIVAVEVYPAIDQEWHAKSQVRVLWILPTNWPLPFGLHLPNAWGQPQEKRDG
jgi:hypothetical protein